MLLFSHVVIQSHFVRYSRVAALLGSIFFILSVVMHGLAQSLMAKRCNLEIDTLVLWCFGGVSQIKNDIPNPLTDFLISAVGPICRFITAGVFLLIAYGAYHLNAPFLVVATLEFIALSNIINGLFNLLPAYPLDGGRMFRSFLWKLTGDKQKATKWAGYVGMVLAWSMIIGGLVISIASDYVLDGVWLLLIGAVLLTALNTQLNYMELSYKLEKLQVKDIMAPYPVTVDPRMTVERFLHDVILQHKHTAYPVVNSYGTYE